MKNLFTAFAADDRGFIVSGELVLVSTIAVLAMIVGLSELSFNINEELEDMGSGFGGVDQSYRYALATGAKGDMIGSAWSDSPDAGDGMCDINCNGLIAGEGY